MRKLNMEELNRLTVDEFRHSDKTSLVVVLDNIRSQNNIGSIFRTCDAFLVETLYLCGITATPPHKEIHKTALGATDTVSWKYVDDTLSAIHQLKGQGYTILAAEQTDKSTFLQEYRINPAGKYVLILGHEFRGVEQAVINECDACIEIPQFGTKHSLNVSVSAGIMIWHFYREMKMQG
jgi:23S rRNA (guanosine2251-2'-O)-methyltransferase